jgi:L-amino acid N-acyltransferase YncA
MDDAPPIRLATPEDAAAVANIYRPIVESTSISFEAVPPTEAEMRQRMADIQTTYPWLVLVHSGEIAGYAYGSRHRPRAAYQWSVETTVYVAEGYRRRGVGRRLYAALFNILKAQGFAHAFAGIALPNPASVALHELVGFQPIGVFRSVGFKFNEWRDVGWWQRSLLEGNITLLTVGELQQRPSWRALLSQ